MIKYFKELLDTLIRIEKHLSKISETVDCSPKHGNYSKVIRTSHWND